MKFNLHLLADRLKAFSPHLINDCSTNFGLQGVLVIDKNAQCTEEYVYLVPHGREHLVNRQNDMEHLSFILLEEHIEKIHVSSNWDVIVISTNYQLINIYEKIMQAVTELNFWYNDLSDAILCQKDLQIEMDIAARYLKNPVALFDMSISLITWAGPLPGEFADPVWRNVLGQGYNTLETFPKEFGRQMSESVGRDEIVIVPPMDKPSENHNMMATLYHNGLPFACMAMNELCQSFDLAEYSYIVLIKKLLEKSPVLLQLFVMAGEKGSKIFLRLLKGTSIEEGQFAFFLRERRWRKDDEFRLYLFRFVQEKKLNENSFRAYSNLILSADPSLELFYIENNILAIERGISQEWNDSDHDFRLQKLERIRKVQKQIGMLVGVSMKYQGYQNLNHAMLQAEAAWRYATYQKWMIWYEDIYQQYILDQLNRSNNLLHYCHPCLLLFNVENDWDKELLCTLSTYLQNGKRVSATADMLHIHRNTMLNRLRIINERLNGNVDEMESNEKTLLMLSCMIIENSNAIQPQI